MFKIYIIVIREYVWLFTAMPCVLGNPCVNGGTCMDVAGTAECTCPAGFTDLNCSTGTCGYMSY